MKLYDFDATISNCNDWSKKYCSTVVLLNGSPAYMTTNDNGQTTMFKSRELGTITVPTEAPPEEIVSVEAYFPEAGWVFVNGGLPVYICKYPARQWHKSYCKGTYGPIAPYTLATRTTNIIDTNIFWQLHVRNDFIPLNDRLDSVVSKKAGGAILSDSLAVVRFEEDTWGLVSPNGFVGYVRPTEGRILTPSIVAQELIDLLKTMEFQWKLETM